jgi:hypothetical protein
MGARSKSIAEALRVWFDQTDLLPICAVADIGGMLFVALTKASTPITEMLAACWIC